MKVIKLNKIDSTQDYLKKVLESQPSEQDYLVIANEQINGVGRHGNDWDHVNGSLACSFTLNPNKILTLTSIELAVLIAKYFHTKHDIILKLKWPNDLFFQNKKCGGIIIHIHNQRLIVGLGINAISTELEQSKMRIGLDLNFFKASDLVNFIHNHRIKDDYLIKKYWMENCIHINESVQIGDKTGVFTGLGDHGEAIITNGDQHDKIISGSLRCLFL